MTEYAIVERPGPLTLIQDCGRRGQQHLGVSVGGALDSHAAGWANRLLHNPPQAALLEICLGPFALRFPAHTCIAITGADCGWQLDGKPLDNWRAHRVGAGSLLTGSTATCGLRSYMALAGGILTPPVWGSRATTVAEKLGGLQGAPLARGDLLPYGPQQCKTLLAAPPGYVRQYSAEVFLRVAASNQFTQFPPQSRRDFFSRNYRVAPESDRMGVRMSGEPLSEVPGNMTSEAVAPGAIQIPGNGLPIVLMRDCQTIGGYPKLGHVYRVDLDRLAQARPGTQVRFVLGSLTESQAELAAQLKFFGSGQRV
ncbi:biotin-dependent carboxyltransferase family protein [Microbulbifer sp. TYP-18]|uniref:biotin-dependent carboxyltransferase family protein n=1 Tax=Microbulbifer sp. TYP-18 TaxID=3230024 RepID=UPI0034C6C3EE